MQPKLTTLLSAVGMLCLCFITPTQALHSNYFEQYIKVHANPTDAPLISDLLANAEQDPAIQYFVDQYIVRGKHTTEKLLGKAAYYFPIFEFHLQKQGLPKALKYLPAVESYLYANVRSERGAVGLWQFMPATARYYGLRVDEEVDERYDVHLASEAAALMLADLFEQFEDWTLALAAYNCGPGRVRKAIRKAGSSDYQKLRKYLPKQTRQYTDKITAFIYVGEHHQALGIQPKISLAFQKKLDQKVTFYGAYNLQSIAKAAQMDYAQLQVLNPQYREAQLPAYQKHELVVPDYAKVLLDNYFQSRIAPELESQEFLSLKEMQLSQLCFHKTIPHPIEEGSSHPTPNSNTFATRETWALVRKSTLA